MDNKTSQSWKNDRFQKKLKLESKLLIVDSKVILKFHLSPSNIEYSSIDLIKIFESLKMVRIAKNVFLKHWSAFSQTKPV